MKEIGGYFGLEKLVSHEYYSDLKALNTARNALIYILKARKARKIYLPHFLCGSVSAMCEKEGFEAEFYHIDADFMPLFDKKLNENEWLYIVNYYGQLDNDCAAAMKKKYGNIIFDNVQAFFQRPAEGVDTVYSCRKFFGVPDGAYASTDAVLDEKLDTDISMNRLRHIMGRFEMNSASDYYDDFKSNDHAFYDTELREMSAFTHNILGAVDYEAVIEKRNRNFMTLSSHLEGINGLTLKTPVGPYAYPFYCKNGMEIKKMLAQKKIFVATLWPDVLKMDDTIEKDYAENILPLPCDQRYDEDDMIYAAKEVLKCVSVMK